MQFSNSNNFTSKTASLILIGILFCNEIIPFARACESLSNGFHSNESRFFGMSEKSENYDNSEIRKNEVHNVDQNTDQSSNIQFENQMILSGGGPQQSETSGFSVNSTDGMVDKFSGDFSYSIPLMDVEGYPIVINYNSNIGMNSDASWVGLGWDLSVGAVSREMRGLPDEFNGEQVIARETHQKEYSTENGWKAGVYGGVGYNFKSKYSLGLQSTILGGGYYNTYLGKGFTFDFDVKGSFSIGKNWRLGPTLGLGFSLDTKNGIGSNHSYGLNAGYGKSQDVENGSFSASYGASTNSRIGTTEKMLSLNMSGGYDNTNNKGNEYGGSVGTGSSISLGTATSIPRVIFNETGTSDNVNLSLFMKTLIPSFYWLIGLKGVIYSSNSTLQEQVVNQPAYGYLHSGKRKNSDKEFPVMDYNRAADNAFSEEMSNLSFSFQTYDFFHVDAMGISGNFRANRTDYGTYYDPIGKSDFSGLVIDLGVGYVNGTGTTPSHNAIEIQAAGGSQSSGIESTSWTGDNGFPIEFEEQNDGDNFDNSVYFKSIGEPTTTSMEAWDMLGGTNRSRFKIDKNVSEKKMDLFSDLVTYPNTTNPISSSDVNAANEKPIIATVFKPSIAGSLIGSASNYYSFGENIFVNASQAPLPRVGGIKAANHISKLEVVSTEGTKYTYSIPVYNKFYDEVSFSVGGRSVNPQSRLINYLAGDNSSANNLGRSNFFDRTKMPSFAHSFLLTEMTSSDYIDRTGNGPSLDDIGSYYKFNYTQVYGELEANDEFYKWRFPVSGGVANEAFHNRGFEGSELDDIGSYTYGEKEIWYTHSVESKNLVAEFYLENREDAYGVEDENGLLDTSQPLKLLKKIVLYNKSDRMTNGLNATPLQIVEFEYDYSLCKKNPSNKYSYSPNYDLSKSGKLTLKAIRVQNGNSIENKLAKYKFEYSAENPDFNYADVDGWGNYKQNNSLAPNDINPYTVQNESVANSVAKSWKLKTITNPTRGSIEIEYEADRYSYVQNQRAMKHINVHGMTNLIQFLYLQTQSNWNGADYVGQNFTTDLGFQNLSSFFQNVNYNWTGLSAFFEAAFDAQNSIKGGVKYAQKYGKFVGKLTPNNVVIFALDKQIDGGLSSSQAGVIVKDKYFKKDNINFIKDLYLRMHVDVKTGVKELVQTFATISGDQVDPFDNDLPFGDDFKAIGVMPKDPVTGDYKYGYVILEPVNSGDKESSSGKDLVDGGSLLMNPLQKTSLEYVRQNLPDKIYGSCVGCDPNLSIDWKMFFGGDMYRAMIEKGGYVESFFTDYSTLRLYVQDSIKYSSTARVKNIIYRDNWDFISSEPALTSTYKWTYIYEDSGLCSGVSSYEPRTAADENSLYNWETYIDTKKKFPDETKFSVLQLADPLFPNAQVGYAVVKVLFNESIDKGYSKNEFYTSKDYPTTEINTDVVSPSKIKKVNPLFGNSTEVYGFSQGYLVQTNDFHGKPKQSSVYDRYNNIQQRSTYEYYNLGEKQKTIDRNGAITEESIAIEYDVHNDSRYLVDSSSMWLFGLDLKLMYFTPTGFGFSILPNFFKTSRKRGFYSTCMVKHINRSAQVKSIETQNMMSINSAENLLYDKYSGNVVLSSLNDEFDDALYSFNYPSHWYYEQFRELNGVDEIALQGAISGGVFSITGGMNLTNYLVPGDYVNLSSGSSNSQAWVLETNSNSVSLIQPNGAVYAGLSGANITLTILKSNRKNRLTETMKSVVTKKTPSISVGNFIFPETEIISSSVLTYNDRNNMRCTREFLDKPYNEVIEGQPVNPFLYGAKGNLIFESQFAWQSERINDQHAHGIRFDGTFSEYFPFYKYNQTEQKWFRINEPQHPDHEVGNAFKKWRNLGKVKTYDEYGKPLESVDQLNVFSATLYGYHHGLMLVPIAQAVNARQQDIAFDGFEDYSYYSSFPFGISETHFDFEEGLTQDVYLTTEERHTGLNSLRVNPSNSVFVEKQVSDNCNEPGNGISSGKFVAESCLCIKPFEPAPGDYIVSVWVKEKTSSFVESYTNAKLSISINGGTPQLYPASGPIIDGWQRLEIEFNIPTNASTITIGLDNSIGTNEVYFDDLRIHPYLAGMTTVVYDPNTLLPLATHDGYNFSTFYNYDENLNQVRVRVETVEGIKTVSESEFGGQKQY